MTTNKKNWKQIEEELEEEIVMALYGLPEEWNEVTKKYGCHDANYGVLGLGAKKIVAIVKPYFQELLHKEAKEELETVDNH